MTARQPSPPSSRFLPALVNPTLPHLNAGFLGLPALTPPALNKNFTLPNLGDVITYQGRQYYLGKEIGAGYFGTVFECTDEWGNELVAKVLLPRNRTYEAVRQAWLRELQNLVNLRHPNITHIYDAFECRDTFYLIIERCSFSLYDLIVWPDLKGEVWIKPVAKCILQALDFIHKAGYVHKDLHPGNVFTRQLRGEMGEPKSVTLFKVGDLGISRLEPDIRVLNTILAQWMLPPEFLNPSEFGSVGRATDIYHAGLLFLSILRGCVPSFTRDEILAGAPRKLAESLASPFAPVIALALRRHVDHRMANALQFWRGISAVSSA